MPGQGTGLSGFQGSFKHRAHLTSTREKFSRVFATLGRKEEKTQLWFASQVLPTKGQAASQQPRGQHGHATVMAAEQRTRWFYSPQGVLVDPGGWAQRNSPHQTHTPVAGGGESPRFSSIAGCSSPPAKPGITPPPPAASVASQSEAELCRVSKRNPACEGNLQKLPQGHTVLLNTAHLLLRSRDSPHSFKDQNEYKYHQEQIFEHPLPFFCCSSPSFDKAAGWNAALMGSGPMKPLRLMCRDQHIYC